MEKILDIKKTRKLYKHIKEIAQKMLIDIYEDFVGNETFIWRLKSKEVTIILPSKYLELDEKIKIICYELNFKDLDDIYILPELRDYIDNTIKTLKKQQENMTDLDIANDFDFFEICELCGKPMKKVYHQPSLLKICHSCLHSQVRYNIDYKKCNKEMPGKYCLDCPSKIYNKCPIIKYTLMPEKFKNIDPKKNADYVNKRFNYFTRFSNVKNFDR